MPTSRLGLALLLAPLASASAATIQVPSGVADLQTAIDSAAPFDTIRVDGGVWDDIAIGQPLSIVGAVGNRPTIRCTTSNPGLGGCDLVGAVTLAGTGTGYVELVNLDIDGGSNDNGLFCNPFGGVVGGGFPEVRLVDCAVTAGDWGFVTGLAQGADAVRLDVPLTVVQGSTLVGGSGADDGSGLGSFFLPTAGRGLATTGDLVATESDFVGGDGVDESIFDFFMCPPSADTFNEGEGGAGADVAGTLYRYDNTTFQGGDGSTVLCIPTNQLYVKADGVDFVAGIDAPGTGDLETSGPVIMGQPWSLTWTSGSPISVLVFGLPLLPTDIGPKGTLFVNPGLWFLFYFSGTGPQGVQFTATADPVYLGLTLAFQVYDTTSYTLGNPVYGTHQN